LVSSTCAIHESIKRRPKKQEDLLKELEGLTPAQRAKRLAALQGRLPDAEQDEDGLDDAVRDQLVDEYTAALELEQLRAEISTLKELVEQARRVRENANDSMLAGLIGGVACFVDPLCREPYRRLRDHGGHNEIHGSGTRIPS
jgi:chromosome segregation ATPase